MCGYEDFPYLNKNPDKPHINSFEAAEEKDRYIIKTRVTDLFAAISVKSKMKGRHRFKPFRSPKIFLLENRKFFSSSFKVVRFIACLNGFTDRFSSVQAKFLSFGEVFGYQNKILTESVPLWNTDILFFKIIMFKKLT